ncbi:hypothetical protein LTR12_016990 [Friedmanniomyces endolithicus]|nr:hypothetical protein LTR12_016990 [Friedmanniomyces endolithicus]
MDRGRISINLEPPVFRIPLLFNPHPNTFSSASKPNRSAYQPNNHPSNSYHFDLLPIQLSTPLPPNTNHPQQHNKMPSMIKIAMAAATIFGVFTAAKRHNPSVDFIHFTQPGCPAEYQLRKKPYDLDAGQCKDFPAWMPPFESFKTIGKWSRPHTIETENCHLLIFDQPKCQGTSYAMGNVVNTHEQCGNVPSRHGKSVKFVCEPKPVSSSIMAIPIIPTSTIAIEPIPSSTSTSIVSIFVASTTTIPAPSSTTTTTVSAVLPMSTITTAAEVTTISLSAVSSPCTHGCN